MRNAELATHKASSTACLYTCTAETWIMTCIILRNLQFEICVCGCCNARVGVTNGVRSCMFWMGK